MSSWSFVQNMYSKHAEDEWGKCRYCMETAPCDTMAVLLYVDFLDRQIEDLENQITSITWDYGFDED